MAQDFERYIQRNVGTSAATIHTSNSDDAIVSIRCANSRCWIEYNAGKF